MGNQKRMEFSQRVREAKTMLVLIMTIFLVSGLVKADTALFSMEGKLPVISISIGGSGAGQQTLTQNTTIAHQGKASLRWEYKLSSIPQGNYPTIELTVPMEKQNWQGIEKLGVWLYLDITNPKTSWTIQPVISPTAPGRIIELGNWNAGEKGIPPRTWIYHEWPLPQSEDLSKITHLRFYYHAGDGWKDVASSGKVSICLDDITLVSRTQTKQKAENTLMKGTNPTFNLGFKRDNKTGKALFTLNEKPYLPVMYSENFRQVNQEFLDFIKSKSCNGLVLATDVADAGSEQLKKALELCVVNNIPVIVEVNEGDFWGLLRKKLELNMLMLNGNPVRYFPDYANPQTKLEHLARFRKAAQFLKSYAHSPIIGISVGAYDAYHLPDGEVHLDFTIPSHPQKNGTYLPYGPWVEKEFAKYIGSTDKKIPLPDTLESAGSSERWKQWVLFRRALVKSWLKDTLDTVRQESGLPATVTFDINFTLQERYATAPFDWTKIMDFVIVYYYGRSEPSDYIPRILRTVYKEFTDAGKPMMTLLEFSSAGKKTSGIDYAKVSAPFVSGFITTGPIRGYREDDAQKGERKDHGEERVFGYLDWLAKNKERISNIAPPNPEILILVDKEAIHFENPFTGNLSRIGLPYAIQYVSSQDKNLVFKGYKFVLVPKNFSSTILSRIQTDGTLVIEKEGEDFLKKMNIKDTAPLALNDWKKDKLILEDTFDGNELNQWYSSLPKESWKLKNGRLVINKTDQNVKGFASRTVFQSPYLLEAILSFGSTGNPRLTFMDSNGYLPTTAGQDPAPAANELSFGTNPTSSGYGEFGFYLFDWERITSIPLEQDYLVRVYVLPATVDNDNIHLSLYSLKNGKEELVATYSNQIPKRKADRLWLLWAWDKAQAEIDSIRIYSLSKIK